MQFFGKIHSFIFKHYKYSCQIWRAETQWKEAQPYLLPPLNLIVFYYLNQVQQTLSLWINASNFTILHTLFGRKPCKLCVSLIRSSPSYNSGGNLGKSTMQSNSLHCRPILKEVNRWPLNGYSSRHFQDGLSSYCSGVTQKRI